MLDFTWYGKGAAIYGAYSLEQLKSGDSSSMVSEFNKAKEYCSTHGYSTHINHIFCEMKEGTPVGESMEFRKLIEAIENDELKLVLFTDFTLISRNQEQVKRLVELSEAHRVTLIDVSSQQVITTS